MRWGCLYCRNPLYLLQGTSSATADQGQQLVLVRSSSSATDSMPERKTKKLRKVVEEWHEEELKNRYVCRHPGGKLCRTMLDNEDLHMFLLNNYQEEAAKFYDFVKGKLHDPDAESKEKPSKWDLSQVMWSLTSHKWFLLFFDQFFAFTFSVLWRILLTTLHII